MDYTRRDFLKTTVVGGATVASAGIAAEGCGNPVDVPPETVKIAADASGKIVLPIARVPALQRVGGAVTLDVQAPAGGAMGFMIPKGGLLMVRRGATGDSPEWIAVDSACPHLRCPLGYSAKDDAIECPCHASRFLAKPDPALPSSKVGTVTHLPAMVDIPSYPVVFDVATQTCTIDMGSCSTDAVLPAPVAGVITASLDTPALVALKMVGGFVQAQVAGNCFGLLLVRVDMNTVNVLDLKCTHQGCFVEYELTSKVSSNPDVWCRCHDSHFDLATGKVTKIATAADAKQDQGPLKKYSATLSVSTLTIQFA